MFSKTFWAATAERAVKTFAQSLLASITVFTGLLNVSWVNSLSAAGLGGLISVLTSVASAKFGPEGSPSLVNDTAVNSDPSMT